MRSWSAKSECLIRLSKDDIILQSGNLSDLHEGNDNFSLLSESAYKHMEAWQR
jgi:hypothetical protein